MTEEITVQEFNRRLPDGTWRYVHYNGRFLRSKVRRGKPSYETVHGVVVTSVDRTHYRKVNVQSQVARKLLSVIY